MITSTPVVGTPLDRVDGVAKVTGQARYAGEYPETGPVSYTHLTLPTN